MRILFFLANSSVPFLAVMGLVLLILYPRLRFSKGRTAVIFMGLLLAAFCLNMVGMGLSRYGGSPSLIYLVIFIPFSLLSGLLLFRCSLPQIAFTFFLIKSYMDDVFLISKALQVYWGSFYWKDVTESFMLSYGIVLIATFPLMCLFLSRCLRPLMESEDSKVVWRFLWMIPVLFYVIYRLGISPAYPSPEVVWDQTGIALPLLWAVGTFFCYFVIAQMLLRLEHSSQLREKLHLTELQLQMQGERYDALKNSIDETHRIRHDLRHQLVAIRGYAEQGDIGGLTGYLDGYLKTLSPDQACPACGNYAVDSIIQYYAGLARQIGADVDVSLALPDKLSLPENDVCIVLGNLLENAVEACHRGEDEKKFIQIKAGLMGDGALTISVRNSFWGQIRKKGDAYLSAKRNGEGIGIASVRGVVEKYGGISKFEVGEGVFCASVLLNPVV